MPSYNWGDLVNTAASLPDPLGWVKMIWERGDPSLCTPASPANPRLADFPPFGAWGLRLLEITVCLAPQHRVSLQIGRGAWSRGSGGGMKAQTQA